jgi:protein-S-isoprenylcysteine O-methyltransferase Ste14
MKSSDRRIESYRILASRVFALLIGLLTALSTSRWSSDRPLAGAALFALGCVLVGIGSMGRLWCTLYIAGRKNRSLVVEGPYSLCRNPLYFFSFTGILGLGLATETLTIPALLLMAFALYYPHVIRSEEARLRRIHGDDFDAYVARVPCFLPNPRLLREPPQYSVEPRLFRRHLRDALWFIWLVGGLQVVSRLHATAIVSTLVRLW